MTRVLTVLLGLGLMLAAAPASAHHAAASLGTVTISQPVLAGGTMLQPGTYEIRDTGEHVKPLPGQSEEAQTNVEFVMKGKVVAKDVAEVMTGEARPVGTSGGATARLRFERLRGDDFTRISTFRGSERYLIHLPTVK